MNRSTYLTLVLILGFLTGIEPLTVDMTLPAVQSIATSIGSSSGEIQVSLGLFVLGLAAGQLFFGPFADRFGRKPVLLVGLAVYIVVSLACASAGNAELVKILRLLQGMSAAIGQSLVRAIVRDHFHREAAARVLAFIMVILASTPIIAPFAGSWITVSFGWRWLFLFFAAYGTLNLILVFCFYRESIPARNPDALSFSNLLGNFRTILSTRAFVSYTLCSISAFCGLFAFLSAAPLVLIGGSGLTLPEFSLAFAAVMIPQALMLLLSGFLIGRIDMDRLLGCGIALGLVSGLIMLASVLLSERPVMAVVLPAGLYMISFSLIVPNAVAGAISPFPRMAGVASSLMGFFQFATAGLLAALVGWLSEGSGVVMAVAMTLSGILGVCGLFYPAKRASPRSC